MYESFTFRSHDGQELAGHRWGRPASPRAVIQIAHGASEHAGRYGRVAEVLAEAGYAIVANDHRGHGRTAAEHGRFGVARPGGWAAIVRDTRDLSELARQEHPGAPLVLFGHSMGSMIAQGYFASWGEELAGLVLSGTAGGALVDPDTLAAIVELGASDAADEPSEAFAAMFAAFNEPFDEPGATGFEWLSRDEAEVQAYVDDPWCGEPLSNGFVADMLEATAVMWQPEAEAGIPTGVPVLIFSGARDPVGGPDSASVRDLAARYEAAGVPVTLRLYEGGRHEMLNEVNRARVHADLLAWLDQILP